MLKSDRKASIIILGAMTFLMIGIGTVAGSITLQITSSNLDILATYPEEAYFLEPSSKYEGNLLGSFGQRLDADYKTYDQGYTQLADTQNLLKGQCVSACKSLAKSNIPTKDWLKGDQVVNGGVSSGTVIATFLGPGEKYEGHAAIFKDYVYDRQGNIIGIEVWDQRWPPENMNLKKHRISRSGEKISNADNYYTVLVTDVIEPSQTFTTEKNAEINVNNTLDKLKKGMDSFTDLSSLFAGSFRQSSEPVLSFDYRTSGVKYCKNEAEASSYMTSRSVTDDSIQEALYVISHLGLERTGFCVVIVDYTYSAFGTTESKKYPIVCNEDGDPYWQSWQLYSKLNQILDNPSS